MEKSIETIWKEGFLKNDALVAPKLNDIYNQKSIDIVEKFKRMYKLNRIGIILFAIIIVPVSYITKMIYTGIPMAILFTFVSVVAAKFNKKLNTIDKNKSSYEYLNSFNIWIKNMVDVNSKLSTFIYPYIFVAVALGFWFIEVDGKILGDLFINGFISKFPSTPVVYGFPILLVIPFILIIGILAFFGGKIGKWDINLVYGRIIKRLDTLLSDMEELRA
jgi:hypothetical protein